MIEAPNPGFRAGYAALIGKPNAGKSTLLNQLVGQKLSIVTRKAQTTRNRILGIVSTEEHQIIFLDTPGVIQPKYGLQQRMMKGVRRAIADSDVMLFVVDATLADPDTRTLSLITEKPALLILNKIDLIDEATAMPLVKKYSELHPFAEVIPASAKTGYHMDLIRDTLVSHLPVGPQLYPDEMISDMPERFFVAELVREQLFLRVHEEVPYHCQVNVVAYEEKEDGKDLIDVEIVVDRESQKGIVIGKGGRTLKEIGSRARVEIEEFLQRGVFLRLFVKVRQGWRDSDTQLRSFGFDREG